MLMEKKIIIILEVLFVIVLSCYYTIKEVIPQYKEKFGSSDSFILFDQYDNLFEINISNGAHFTLAYNKKGKIFHIFFFNEESFVLYNQNIENLSLDKALDKIFYILKNNGFHNQTITVTYYEEEGYSSFKKKINELLNNPSNYIENKDSITNLAKRLGIDSDKDSSIIRELDFYSKEIIKDIKDRKSYDDSYYEEQADSIYNRLNDYIMKQEIDELDKDKVIYPIQIIPSDRDDKLFPNGDSWYYVKDKKVYAYIEFSNSNGYCYLGSINDKRRGGC